MPGHFPPNYYFSYFREKYGFNAFLTQFFEGQRNSFCRAFLRKYYGIGLQIHLPF
jgi:hypothetical protein